MNDIVQHFKARLSSGDINPAHIVSAGRKITESLEFPTELVEHVDQYKARPLAIWLNQLITLIRDNVYTDDVFAELERQHSVSLSVEDKMQLINGYAVFFLEKKLESKDANEAKGLLKEQMANISEVAVARRTKVKLEEFIHAIPRKDQRILEPIYGCLVALSRKSGMLSETDVDGILTPIINAVHKIEKPIHLELKANVFTKVQDKSDRQIISPTELNQLHKELQGLRDVHGTLIKSDVDARLSLIAEQVKADHMRSGSPVISKAGKKLITMLREARANHKHVASGHNGTPQSLMMALLGRGESDEVFLPKLVAHFDIHPLHLAKFKDLDVSIFSGLEDNLTISSTLAHSVEAMEYYQEVQLWLVDAVAMVRAEVITDTVFVEIEQLFGIELTVSEEVDLISKYIAALLEYKRTEAVAKIPAVSVEFEGVSREEYLEYAGTVAQESKKHNASELVVEHEMRELSNQKCFLLKAHRLINEYVNKVEVELSYFDQVSYPYDKEKVHELLNHDWDINAVPSKQEIDQFVKGLLEKGGFPIETCRYLLDQRNELVAELELLSVNHQNSLTMRGTDARLSMLTLRKKSNQQRRSQISFGMERPFRQIFTFPPYRAKRDEHQKRRDDCAHIQVVIDALDGDIAKIPVKRRSTAQEAELLWKETLKGVLTNAVNRYVFSSEPSKDSYAVLQKSLRANLDDIGLAHDDDPAAKKYSSWLERRIFPQKRRLFSDMLTLAKTRVDHTVYEIGGDNLCKAIGAIMKELSSDIALPSKSKRPFQNASETAWKKGFRDSLKTAVTDYQYKGDFTEESLLRFHEALHQLLDMSRRYSQGVQSTHVDKWIEKVRAQLPERQCAEAKVDCDTAVLAKRA